MEGQAVKKGQLLLELDVKDALAQLAQAQARLLQAQDDLRAALGGGRSDAAARASGIWRRRMQNATASSGIMMPCSGSSRSKRRRKTSWPQTSLS